MMTDDRAEEKERLAKYYGILAVSYAKQGFADTAQRYAARATTFASGRWPDYTIASLPRARK